MLGRIGPAGQKGSKTSEFWNLARMFPPINCFHYGFFLEREFGGLEGRAGLGARSCSKTSEFRNLARMIPPINCFHYGFFPGERIRKFGQVEGNGRPLPIIVVPVIVVPVVVFNGFFLEKEFGSLEGRAGLGGKIARITFEF